MSLVDMHCHLVYGVDDGAQKESDMQDMLRLAAENGVRHIVCTSHITPGEEPFPAERYADHLRKGQAFCEAEGLDIVLHPGSEILYTDHTPRMVREGKVPRLNGKWAVLVEFWYEVPFEKLCEAAEKLGERGEGMTVVFAHIERYKTLRSIRQIEKLRDDYGVLMQMNARTVYTKQGFLTDRWKKKAIGDGLIDMIASDAHNTGDRPCNMLKAWEWLRDAYDTETADWLCGGSQTELLEL